MYVSGAGVEQLVHIGGWGGTVSTYRGLVWNSIYI